MFAEWMTKIFGESWKTTTHGLASAVAITMIPVLQGQSITTKDIVLAVVIGVLGFIAKDGNK